jgi:hypothetical protein
MDLADDTHDYSCTPCRHTGSACFESLLLARTIARAQHQSGHNLPAGAELVTARQFHGCGHPCNVLLKVRHGVVEVTAGMPDCCDETQTLHPAAQVTARSLPQQAVTDPEGSCKASDLIARRSFA